MRNEPPRFELIDIPTEEWDELAGRASHSVDALDEASALLVGTWKQWPCPFGARGTSCNAVGRVAVDERGVPQLPTQSDAERESGNRTWGFLTDPLGTLLTGLAESEMAKHTRCARAYECAEHGVFYVPFSGGNPNPSHIWVTHDGVLQERQARFTFCPGLIQGVDQVDHDQQIEVCCRILEWQGEAAIGFAPGRYTCPIHGSQTFHADGRFTDFASQIARQLVPRGPTLGPS